MLGMIKFAWIAARCTRSLILLCARGQTLDAFLIQYFDECGILYSAYFPWGGVTVFCGAGSTNVWYPGLFIYREWLSEIKTPWNISPADIVKQYNNERECSTCTSLVHAIRQVFGYMGDAKMRYSVLSTYTQTWFMYRPVDHPGSLYISDCIELSSTNPTLLCCILSMVLLSRGGNHVSPTPPPSPSPSPPSPPHSDSEPSEGDDHDQDPSYNPEDNRSRKQRQGGTQKGYQGSTTNVEQFNWGEFDITVELGQGRCGVVYEAIFRGDRVAVKIGDIGRN